MMMKKQVTWCWMALAAGLMLLAGRGFAQDPFMGEYEGTYQADKLTQLKATGKVIAVGPGYYRMVLTAVGDPKGEGTYAEIYGIQQGNGVNIVGRYEDRSNWSGSISDGHLLASGNYYGCWFDLKKTVRKSPTEGAKPPEGAVVLLPYEPGQKPDLSAWSGTWKPRDDGSVEGVPGSGSFQTKKNFRDVKLHVEFWLPLEAGKFGQERANSGVYLSGNYEVQVLDSFGLTSTNGDCAAIYDLTRPLVNASLPPETWQTYDIIFHATRMEGGKTIKNPRVTVVHNGVTVQQDVEVPGPTGAKEGTPNVAEGPLGLQDHGHPDRYRNIWLVELKDGQE